MVPNRSITHEIEGARGFLECLSCLNNGRVTGDWLDSLELFDPVSARPSLFAVGVYSRTGSEFVGCARCGGDELIVSDTEGFGSFRSESWVEVLDLLEVLEGIDEDQREAFLAFCGNQHFYDLDALAHSFESCYRGSFDSWSAYVDDYIEQTAHFDGLPEWVERYFDAAHFGRDLAHDYTVLEHGSGVFVFSEVGV